MSGPLLSPFFLMFFFCAIAIYQNRRNLKGENFEMRLLLKFIYSEKATKFCEISTVDLTVTT